VWIDPRDAQDLALQRDRFWPFWFVTAVTIQEKTKDEGPGEAGPAAVPGPPRPKLTLRRSSRERRMGARAERSEDVVAQMEPTDQLDAPNRRLPEGRVRRFAKRLLRLSETLTIPSKSNRLKHFSNARVGSCWLDMPGFLGTQGRFEGQRPAVW
jgi:hypothetical protein